MLALPPGTGLAPSLSGGDLPHIAQNGVAEALRIELASLDKLDDLAGETVALPFVRGLQNLHCLIVGAPHCFHDIENVRGHRILI